MSERHALMPSYDVGIIGVDTAPNPEMWQCTEEDWPIIEKQLEFSGVEVSELTTAEA